MVEFKLLLFCPKCTALLNWISLNICHRKIISVVMMMCVLEKILELLQNYIWSEIL